MDFSLPADEQPDLAVDGKGKKSQLPREFMADDLFGPEGPAIEFFYRRNGGGAKAGCMTV